MEKNRTCFGPFVVAVVLLVVAALAWYSERLSRRLAETETAIAQRDLKTADGWVKDRTESIGRVVTEHLVDYYAENEIRDCKKLQYPQNENCIAGAKARLQYRARKGWEDMERRSHMTKYSNIKMQ